LPDRLVTVVIPTLAADAALESCIACLSQQTFRGFEAVIVDNSGAGRVRNAFSGRARVIENERNVGFGRAINQGFHASPAPFLATLNDDALPCPDWLRSLVEAISARPDVGMCASQVRLAGTGLLDSAGMSISGDGTSKQRGHRQEPQRFSELEEVLLPSGSAALYRRAMLEEIGLFDDSFFLYCEDTDLGLRARWAGWRCLYVPSAVVDHRYSHSAGRASPLKAYYVERNRLFVVAKNFPAGMLVGVPFYSLARYFWHLVSLGWGRGAAAEFRQEGNSPWQLVDFVVRAHLALLGALPRLWRERRRIRRAARLDAGQFRRLLRSYWLSVKEAASL
jgi:GT2 family glycosyltransferase